MVQDYDKEESSTETLGLLCSMDNTGHATNIHASWWIVRDMPAREYVTGETVDISEYLNFGFYDRVSYKENAGLGAPAIGRWLGVSHRVDGLMSYWVLTQTGTVISRTTVQRITNLEKETDEFKESIREFDIEISRRFKEEEDLAYDGAKPNPEDGSEYLENDPDFQEEFDSMVNDPKVPEADDDFTPDVFDDTYLNMEVAIPRDGDGPEFAKVTRRLRDKDGLPIGKANNNPILDTRMYEVEYPDGHKASLAANAIAENMLHKSTMRATDTFYSRRSLITEQTDPKSSSRMLSLLLEMETNAAEK
jgi:hypothetical protein